MLYAILYIVCGLAVVSPSLLQKNKKFFNRFTEYQGRFGVVLFLLGIWLVISSLMSLSLLSIAPVLWIIVFIGALAILALGFILGFELIVSYLPKQKAHADKILKKLLPYQKWIGIVAMVIGVLNIIALFIR
jgi:predicted ferric reductase